MRMTRWVLATAGCGGLLVALLAGGCLKFRLTVQMNEDGSGQVIEEVIYGEKVVNISGRVKDAPTVETLTGEEHVRQRLAAMGKGVSLVRHKVDKQPDGSVRLLATYAYQDINQLRLSPYPFGFGWEDAALEFSLNDRPTLANSTQLWIRLSSSRGAAQSRQPPEPLPELEAQQVRALLPIFKDLLEGFEFSLRVEIYRRDQWATATKAHLGGGGGVDGGALGAGGGRLTVIKLTDQELCSNDDALLMIVPWRQSGNEFVFCHRDWPPGPRLMPYVNYIEGGGSLGWRAIQTPHGREYY